MEIAEKDKTLEAQLSGAIEKTNHLKLQGGKIREFTEWNNRCFELRDQIKLRDLQIERGKKREAARLEVEAIEKERLKNPPPEQGEYELLPICSTANRRFLIKWDRHKGIPISYWVRTITPANTLVFDVHPNTQFAAFQRALEVWQMGNG